MRRHFGAIGVFAVLVAVIPLMSLEIGVYPNFDSPGERLDMPAEHLTGTQGVEQIPAQGPDPAKTEDEQGAPDLAAEERIPVTEAPDSFQILDTGSGKVMKVSAKDFVRGALAAEMPPTFHPEALKAQAVAAHTYALCVKEMEAQASDPALKGADFSAAPEEWKTYTTEKIFRERYGDLADAYWKAITDAADAVCDYVMLYNGEPIVAAYCSMNTGMSEDAANVWTGSAPYLIPVESRGDMLAPDYETKQRFSVEQVKTALENAYPGIVLGEEPSGWFTLGERSESGYVLDVQAGSQELPAKDLRTLLDLRSTAFTVEYANEEFCFTVKGYGHGVGLSQYGADWYARQGMDFADILAHYFPGAELGLIRPQD